MNDWIFVLLSHPEKAPMKITSSLGPEKFVHMAIEDKDEAVVFTLIGKDEPGHVAFYVYGSWEFGDPDTFFKRD
jgi:hypothetical protein